MNLLELTTVEERKELLSQTVKPFNERAKEHDTFGTFPFENFEDLKAINYHAITIPKAYGGLALSLCELRQYQGIIGKADGPTALPIGSHMGITKQLAANQIGD